MFVRILGPVVVEVDGVARPTAKPKERAVLAVLALRPGRVVGAETLIDALWGDSPPTTAAKSLQAHVSRVRSQFGADLVHTEGAGYRLDLDAGCVDASRLETAVRAGSDALREDHPDEAIVILRDAVSSWRGDPLTDLADGPFAAGERARLEELHLSAAERLADAHLALGRADDAVADLEGLVQLHPLREPLWARLMLALYRTGRQADALRAYQRARHALVESLGIDPGAELQSLEQRIIDHDPSLLLTTPVSATPEPSSPSPAGEPVMPQSRPPLAVSASESDRFASDLRWASAGRGFPFAARDREGQLLHDAWLDAQTGATVAFVGGEAGIGKTRLVAEFATTVGAGGLVLFGRCDEDLAAAYQPFIQALRTFVSNCPSTRLPDLLGPLSSELQRLIPELTERVPHLPEPMATEPGTSRLRLFDAIRDLLHAIAVATPTVLVLDDLHWATADTLQLLRHIAADLEPAPLLVVGTYRDTDISDGHPLTKVMADLWRAGQRHRVELSSLDDDQVGELLAAATGHDLPTEADSFVAALATETGGNPLFITEVVTHLVESGELARRDGTWTATSPTGTFDLPDGLRDVVLRRVDRLPAETVRLLRLAAIMGPAFDTAVLASVGDLSDEECDDALAPAVAGGLIIEVPNVFARYRFSHALLRNALSDETRGTRRTRLHWRIGAAVDAIHLPDDREALDLVAHHLCAGAAAGDAARAARAAINAGDAALRGLDAEVAVEHFRAALAAIALSRDDALAFDAWFGITQAEILRGRDGWEQAIDAATSALRFAQALDDPTRVGRTIMAVDRVGHSLTRTPDELETLLEEVISRLGPEPTATRGVALAALLEAATAVWTSAFDRQIKLFDEAMTIGLALPDSTEKAFILSKWSSRYILDDHPLVAAACDASRRQWEQSNDPTTEAEWRLGRLEGRFLQGPFFEVTADEALEQVERLERLTLDIRDPILAARTSWVSTGTLIDRGDLDRADRADQRRGAHRHRPARRGAVEVVRQAAQRGGPLSPGPNGAAGRVLVQAGRHGSQRTRGVRVERRELAGPPRRWPPGRRHTGARSVRRLDRQGRRRPSASGHLRPVLARRGGRIGRPRPHAHPVSRDLRSVPRRRRGGRRRPRHDRPVVWRGRERAR